MPRGVYQKSAEHGKALSAALRGNKNSKRHGESSRTHRSPENTAWQNMRARCLRQSHPSFDSYGGRGISVCERWASFENFLADMGRRPGPGYSIDRIDNDGNYESGNCRWATAAEQRANRRAFRQRSAKLTDADREFIRANSGELSQRAMATALGVSQQLVSKIIRRGE